MSLMRLLLILSLLVLIKGLIWISVVPIFQTPDEQAHFAQLQWYAEKKSLVINPLRNLSFEVAQTEELLGTRRDSFGNNKFTYHPEYKTPSLTRIPDFPQSTRTEYVDQEAAGYPPLYYLLSLPFYLSVYNQNIVNRIETDRLLSVLLSLLLAMTAFKIGQEVWKEKYMAICLAILVSFQPMISFVSSGIHPDNLLNLLSSLVVLMSLLILKNGVKYKYLILLFLLFVLGLETKIFIIFLAPVVAAIVAYKFFQNRLGIILAILILLLPIFAFTFQLPIPYMPAVTAQSPLGKMSFGEYLNFRLPKIAFEMWPWYWGIFKWLSLPLPRLVMKIITRVAVLIGAGLLIYFYRAIKKKTFSFEFQAVVFFLFSSVLYLLYLVVWDFRVMQSMGYSQGLQGRYLFPNIVPHMALLLTGATFFKRYARPFAVSLASLMVILNLVALYTIYKSHYG